MKLGLISDTHDDVENVKKAIRIFKNNNINSVIHLGDYISPPIIRLFKGMKLIGVFGNNDGYKTGLIKAFNEIKGEIKGDFCITVIDGLKIAIYHGEFREISEALAKSGNFDIVCTGHLHKSNKIIYDKTLWISVGSAHQYLTKDYAPQIGILNTTSKEFKFIDLK